MKSYLIPAFAALAVLVTGTVGAGTAEAAEQKFQKIPTKGVTLKKKAGYWTECRYTGLGTVCETVYMRAKNGEYRKLRADKGNLKNKGGQVLVCYTGSHNAEVCYWTYTPRASR